MNEKGKPKHWSDGQKSSIRLTVRLIASVVISTFECFSGNRKYQILQKFDILGFAKRTGAGQRKEIYNVITKSGAVFTE